MKLGYLLIFTLIFLVACSSAQRVIPKDSTNEDYSLEVPEVVEPKEEIVPEEPQETLEEISSGVSIIKPAEEVSPKDFNELINKEVPEYSFVSLKEAGGELDLTGIPSSKSKINAIYKKDDVQSILFFREYANPDEARTAGKKLFEKLGRSYTYTVIGKYIVSTLDDAKIIVMGY